MSLRCFKRVPITRRVRRYHSTAAKTYGTCLGSMSLRVGHSVGQHEPQRDCSTAVMTNLTHEDVLFYITCFGKRRWCVLRHYLLSCAVDIWRVGESAYAQRADCTLQTQAASNKTPSEDFYVLLSKSESFELFSVEKIFDSTHTLKFTALNKMGKPAKVTSSKKAKRAAKIAEDVRCPLCPATTLYFSCFFVNAHCFEMPK